MSLLACTLCVAIAGCGSQTPGSQPVGQQTQSLEDFLLAGLGEEYQLVYDELIALCARANGLQQWTSDQGLVDAGHSPENSGEEHASGLQGRQLLESIGTGLVTNYIDRPPDQPATVASRPLTEEQVAASVGLSLDEFNVIVMGPVTTPAGDSYATGCQDWASDEAGRRFDRPRLDALAETYAAEFTDWAASSPGMIDLQRRWVRCMAKSGFPGLEAEGDHVKLVYEQLEMLIEGSTSESSALEFDRTVTLAAWDCSEEVNPERARLRDEFASNFAAEHDIEVP